MLTIGEICLGIFTEALEQYMVQNVIRQITDHSEDKSAEQWKTPKGNDTKIKFKGLHCKLGGELFLVFTIFQGIRSM